MPLTHPKGPPPRSRDLTPPPLFTLEGDNIPRHMLPAGQLSPDAAYQVISDELMLDGNARLNLATFVTTWMEPQARELMGACLDKNMIDKDEYPQTAELEMRCVSILSDLWHAPAAAAATGCSTTGSSEAAMLGGLALKRLWQQRRKAEGKPADKPNLVMGINVQICWEKFANYWDVEMRLVPMEGNRFTLSPEEAVKLCDENTIGVVAILGSTFDGAYEPIEEICKALDDLQERTGLNIPVHVDGASGAFFAPFVDTGLEWDFRLERVASINASGHKYGLVYPGVGWIVWRDAEALPEDLIFWVNYLGDNMPTFALNFSRPGAQVVAQYYNFLRLGFEGYQAVQQYSRDVATRLSAADRRAGAVRAAHARRPAAGVRVQGQGRDRQLHRIRRVQRDARTRLAASGLHIPQEPHRPGGAAGGGAPWLHPRPGRHVHRRPEAAAAAAAEAARAAARRIRAGLPPLMCRLFGLTAAPNRVHARFWLLEAPDSLSQQSRKNADGTGLGIFNAEGVPVLDKQPIAAYEDIAFTGEARHLTSTTFIGHVRKASTGAPAPQNTHPFAMEGRIMAHNGAIGDLPKLEQQLGDHLALVQGDTDSERMFALITSCTERHGGDVSAGIADAAAWLAANIPIYAINLILTTPDGLWALRYPETHELYVLEREAGGTHGSRPLHASSDTMRVHSEHLSRHPAVLLASEPLDEHPDWRLLDAGELLHVGGDLTVTSQIVLDARPAIAMDVTYLHPPAT